jgi:SAM-dependent methyltransferase
VSEQLSFAVLRRQEEIDAARARLEERGLVSRTSGVARAASAVKRRLRLPDPKMDRRPDDRKSWDVLRTIEGIEARLGRDDPVLDVGSYASAILPALGRLGYTNLSGIDLDPRVAEMSAEVSAELVVGDLTETRWPAEHFAAITAISVIEHGVPEAGLFGEVSRLLRPGGLFLFSTDYWPEKIDTSDTRLFGLPWTIFSAAEIEGFVERAAGYGLRPMFDPVQALRDVESRPINFAGRDYTFLHGVLAKTGGATS